MKYYYCVLLLLGCSFALFVYDQRERKEIRYRTDAAPILKRIRGLPPVISAKWIAENTLADTFMAPPSLDSSYRIRGYLQCSINSLELMVASEGWEVMHQPLVPGFSFVEGSSACGNWYYSSQFNKDALPGLIEGNVYVCPDEGVIYFDIFD